MSLENKKFVNRDVFYLLVDLTMKEELEMLRRTGLGLVGNYDPVKHKIEVVKQLLQKYEVIMN